IPREHGAVARAVPRLLRVVPRHDATHMRAACREGVSLAVLRFPHGEPLSSASYHATPARADPVDILPHRGTVAAAVVLGFRAAARIVELRPRIGSIEQPI